MTGPNTILASSFFCAGEKPAMNHPKGQKWFWCFLALMLLGPDASWPPAAPQTQRLRSRAAAMRARLAWGDFSPVEAVAAQKRAEVSVTYAIRVLARPEEPYFQTLRQTLKTEQCVVVRSLHAQHRVSRAVNVICMRRGQPIAFGASCLNSPIII